MNLYSLTLQHPTAITTAVAGRFTNDKAVEILLARDRYLEIIQVNSNGVAKTVAFTNVFGVIRDVKLFHMACLYHASSSYLFTIFLSPFTTDQKRDTIMIGSDSGKMTILEYDTRKERLIPLFNETVGRTGCRRIIPGQYVAIDPSGRAAMIGISLFFLCVDFLTIL